MIDPGTAFVLSLYGAWVLGLTQPAQGRPGRLSALVWGSVALVSTLQLTVWPALETALGRNAHDIARGELWRVLTSVLVQDGGTSGAAFNLLTLAMLLPVTERLCGPRRTFWALLAGTLGGEVAGLLWQPVGAGTSVACAGLAGLLLVTVMREGTSVARQASAVAFALVGLTQLSSEDIHGAALAVGVAAAASGSRRVGRVLQQLREVQGVRHE